MTTEPTPPDPRVRMLDDLIHGRWTLTLEPTSDGGTEVVAYRPLGWTGPNPHERLAAPDHATLRDLLARRHTTEATDIAE
ncbi:hypothetical protein PWG71_01825 [Nocardiopsis sp. N85]|uniref:hypothetical protein n=1 Tax=Nocardiopsis sp. N85 TaxID=3029400 RepID=UPI00237EF731|nr:hypothetical protein [Nocardiopsis sp. N85]MDE3720111.1 hypothetical protein [Nocardiopsis sp. N85]